ncbi:MAG: hypothetical protein ACP6IU_00815 [Candidatus Asgardarchaeia archaeon]
MESIIEALTSPLAIYTLTSFIMLLITLILSAFFYLKNRNLPSLYLFLMILFLWLWPAQSLIEFHYSMLPFDPVFMAIDNILARVASISAFTALFFGYLFAESLEEEKLHPFKTLIIGGLYFAVVAVTISPYDLIVGYDETFHAYTNYPTIVWIIFSMIYIFTTGIVVVTDLIKQRKRATHVPEVVSQINLMIIGMALGFFISPFLIFAGSAVIVNGQRILYSSELLGAALGAVFLIIAFARNPNIVYVTSAKLYGIYLMSEGGVLRYEYKFASDFLREDLLSGFIDALHNFSSYLLGKVIKVKSINLYGYTITLEPRRNYTLIMISDKVTLALITALRELAKIIDNIEDFDSYDFNELDKTVQSLFSFVVRD